MSSTFTLIKKGVRGLYPLLSNFIIIIGGKKIMNELTFSLRDLYPNIATTQEETSQKANPDAEDQTVLNEDADLSEKADNNNASSKMILLAIIIIVCLVVLFGSSK